MKKFLPLFTIVMLTLTSYAQLDVTQFKKVQIGGMYDKTTVTGLYNLVNPYTGDIRVNEEDFRTTTNFEVKFLKSTSDVVQYANLEGFLYFLGRLASLGSKNELFYDFDTYLDPLSAGDCQNIKFFSGPTYNEVARFSNNHLFDISSAKVVKDGPFFIGVGMSLRTLGFPPRYTYYQTETPANYFASCNILGTWKVLYGLNFGFRKNLGSKAAFFLMAGVNRGINKKDKYQSTAIQVTFNPYINPTIFIGGKYGFYAGLYWEYMKGKDKEQVINPSNLVGGTASYADKTYTIQAAATQLQIKLGFYFTTRKERSN